MRAYEIIRAKRDEIRRIVLANHARNPRVFGSVARGEDGVGSDLDLLIDPLPETTLLDLGAIQIALEESLGIRVDVLTPGDLPLRFRAAVVDDAKPI